MQQLDKSGAEPQYFMVYFAALSPTSPDAVECATLWAGKGHTGGDGQYMHCWVIPPWQQKGV